jgi:DedD protein
LEQQAKERLTGGVILVVLLVLLVPELLTGPRPAPPPTPAQPDQAPLRSYTMDLGESPHARAPVAASTSATTAPTATVATPTPAAHPLVASSAPEPTALPPAASAPTLTAQSSAPPLLSPPAVQVPAAEHATAWTVQLGIFSNRENATRLVASLKSHGFNPSMTDATKSGHKLYRVRVGNEHDRAAAQKLLVRLKAAGVKGAEVVAR